MPRVKAAAPETNGTPVPKPTDREWNDYVLGQFFDDEKDHEGNPTVDGLRRVTELLVGPIIAGVPQVVDTPKETNGLRATAIYTVKVAGYDGLEREIGDAADVFPGNTDPMYCRFAVATATTRAEGRALRKILKLRKVVTAEEITDLSVNDSGIGKPMLMSQQKGIEKLCKQLDIDIMKYINAGTNKFQHITHVPYDTALVILEHLNEYLRGTKDIPEAIKGYQENWRTNEN